MGKSKKSRGVDDGGAIKAENRLQAILLADSFKQTFRPITLEKPKVLLPLVNVPMLEYTLEFLASNGVEEVFVFCSWKADQVREYLSTSRWAGSTSPAVRVITSTATQNAGDALRELDAQNQVRSDPFVLVSGDVVSNVDLRRVVALHSERRRKDKSCIMTMLMKRAAPDHRTRSLGEDLVVAYNKRTGQLLRYDDDPDAASVPFDVEFFKEHPVVDFRYDLLDCYIDVCSPEVLLQISDNYDYQDLRKDYVHNEAMNRELGYKIFVHEIQNEYAARVHCPRTYESVSRDIVHRWVYPIVPDNNILGVPGSSYTYTRRSIYREGGVTIAHSGKVGAETVIGAGTVIGENAVVDASVIGRNCRIGAGARISGAFLWDGAVVEDGCTVTKAIVCSGVVVRKGATVSRGCIVSYGCVIGAGASIPEFTKVTAIDPALADSDDDWGSDDDDNDDDGGDSGAVGSGAASGAAATPHNDANIVGEDGIGRAFDDAATGAGGGGYGSDSDDGGATKADAAAHALNCRRELMIGLTEHEFHHLRVARSLRQRRLNPGDGESEAGFDGPGGAGGGGGDGNFGDGDFEGFDGGGGGGGGGGEAVGHDGFVQGIRDILDNCEEDNAPIENILLEINCFKYAENREYVDLARHVLEWALGRAAAGAYSDGAAAPSQHKAAVAAVDACIDKWKPMLKKITQGKAEQCEYIETLEQFIKEHQHDAFAGAFPFGLKALYVTDIIGGDGVQLWTERRNVFEEGAPERSLFDSKLTQQILAMLVEESSSEDESGSDESGSSDDEEDDDGASDE